MLVTYFNSNKAERALIDKALIFAKEQLLPKVRKLEIDVIMKNNMKSDGFVDVDIDDNRYFTLRIKKSQDRDDLITTIFHEFTHIMQSVNGQDIFVLLMLTILKEIMRLKLLRCKKNYWLTLILSMLL